MIIPFLLQDYQKVIEWTFNPEDPCQVCHAPVELSGFEYPDAHGVTQRFCSPHCLQRYLETVESSST